MLIIGSHALFQRLPHLARKPRDLDIIGSWKELMEFQKNFRVSYPRSKDKWLLKGDGDIVEWEIAWPGSLADALLISQVATEGTEYLASIDVLYTLKMSHRYLKDSPHFRKTMEDIHFLRNTGALIFDPEWLAARERETYERRPKLSQNKENFFSGDGVDYLYDHDELHKVVMIGEKPAYIKYQVDGEEVLSSEKKFNDLPHITRMAGVYEEAAVLALERSVIPHQAPPEKAFMLALEKVCTSITSGWFREFAWENYDQVTLFYKSVGEDYYYENFQDALAEGTIKPQK